MKKRKPKKTVRKRKAEMPTTADPRLYLGAKHMDGSSTYTLHEQKIIDAYDKRYRRTPDYAAVGNAMRKRKKHGTVRVIAAFDTPCKHQWFNRADMNLRVCKLCNFNQVINPPDYAAVGERVKVPLSMPPAVEAYMDELQPATGHTGYAPSYDPNHDPKPPVESTMKDIADEMRRVQDGNFYNEVRDLLIKQGDPLLEIPMPELPQGVSQGIDVLKCLGVIIVILVCCLPLAFYGGMFTQSQLPQKPRLSEINLLKGTPIDTNGPAKPCVGMHWNATAGECE